MLVFTKGKKEEKCQFLLYVGRCKGKTDICQFFFLSFFYEPFPYPDDHNNVDEYCVGREGDIPEAVLKAFLAVDNELRR